MPWSKLEDKVLEADLTEWAERQAKKTTAQLKVKAVEISQDIEKYEAKLQETSAMNDEFDKISSKLRKLRLQQEYMSEAVTLEATRSRDPGGDDVEGDSRTAAPPPERQRPVARSKPKENKSSVCSVS